MSLLESLEQLTKWRSVFAAWQLGTRSDRDAECKAVKDHREVSILLRAEVSALTGLLVRKGLVTEAEWVESLQKEAEQLDADFAKRFPGIESTEHGIAYDIEKVRAAGTMDGWPP